MKLKEAIQRIEKRGVLLVFPDNNKKEPPSLWSEFFPRSRMRWEWDSGADNRVPALWLLREELSRSRKVVYAKWFRGRATFFSRPVFTAMLAVFRASYPVAALMPEARNVLSLLEEDSPLSTKELKKRAKLEGHFQESTYTKALKELWRRLLVVGFGEVDDGAFPSLAVGATEAMFDELWREAAAMDVEKADAFVRGILPPDSLFLKEYEKTRRQAPKKPDGPKVFHYGGWS